MAFREQRNARPAGPPWPQATHPVDPTDLVPAMGIVRASRFMSFLSVVLRVPVLPFAENVGKSTGSTIVGDILLRLVTFLQGRPSSFVFACVHLLVPSCHLHVHLRDNKRTKNGAYDTRFTSDTAQRLLIHHPWHQSIILTPQPTPKESSRQSVIHT